MTPGEVPSLVGGALQGILSSTVFLLVLFIGFCLLFGLTKLRPSSRKTMVVRSLEELVGQTSRYLPPNQPRGRMDVLRTPELMEAAAARKNA